MQCLYRSDYGPVDPAFDPFAQHGALLKGYETHVYELAQAQNIGQLEAMERKLARGEPIQWCEQGYGWVDQPPVATFFDVALVFLIIPWMLLRGLGNVFRLMRRPRGAARPAGEAR